MRLLNHLFEDESFLVDQESVPYIVRDIINMNWWNTCDYLIGYQKNRRKYIPRPTYNMKLMAILLKEFYRHNQESIKDVEKLESELHNYILGKNKQLRQLKLFSMQYRRNDSQYFYKDGKPTWLDCTSRATYAWKYVGQNGYMDFDGKCRVKDGNKIIELIKSKSVFPDKELAISFFAEGENLVKKEIFSQRHEQYSVDEWVHYLNIDVIESRKWLFEEIAHVKSDPYKNNEKKLFKEGKLFGNNESHYGFKTMATVANTDKPARESGASGASRASRASLASDASCASNASGASKTSDARSVSRASGASGASYASNASRASHASHASDSSRASSASDGGTINTKEEKFVQSWFDVPAAIGGLKGLDHPPMFLKNKYGLAGHWKINKELVEKSKLGWLDPFLGWGESPLFAKKHGINFTGIEINPDSMNGYILPYVQKACNETGDPSVRVKLILGDSMKFRPELVNNFDLCYTSPPYFDFEDYGFHNKAIQDCFNYDEYHKRVTIPVFTNVKKYLIDDGILALQTEKNKKLKEKWINVILSLGFKLIEDTITGQEKNKYAVLSKRDQSLLVFKK